MASGAPVPAGLSGGPGGAQGPAKPGAKNALADLWHRHPWMVGTGVAGVGVALYVWYKHNQASKAAAQNKGGSRRRGTTRIVIDRGGRGRRHRHHNPGGHKDVAGPATGAEDGPGAQAADESALVEQMDSLQSKLGDYVLAHQRGISPGGPNPGPQAPGMEPAVRGHDLTGIPSPVPAQMP